MKEFLSNQVRSIKISNTFTVKFHIKISKPSLKKSYIEI
jgi:hypothetical protein